MSKMRGVRFTGACLVTMGCVTSGFTPTSATPGRLPPLTLTAVEIGEADLGVLQEHHGVVVGKLELAGNGFTHLSDLEKKAATDAARLGGTHFLLRATGGEVIGGGATAGPNTTRAPPNGSQALYTPGATIPATRPNATCIVLRVPPEEYGALPSPLRWH